jgi:hypothetical protein
MLVQLVTMPKIRTVCLMFLVFPTEHNCRVAEYHLHLPDTFGSYHLINWEIKASAKR